jgi:hypothetical protein
MLPATQDMSLPCGAPLDARFVVSLDLELSKACVIFLNVHGDPILTCNAAPELTIDVPANAINLRVDGAGTQELTDLQVASYQLDIETTDGIQPRILRGRVVPTSGVRPTFA